MSKIHTTSFPATNNLETLSLRKGHFRVLCVASLGQILGAGLSTLIGVIIPMMQLSMHSTLSPLSQGIIGCSSLIGITIGSLMIGRWGDRYGYLSFFRLCPGLVLLASITAFFADGITTLSLALFFMGLGIGGEYSLDSSYISEIMPKRWRLWMVGAAKAASSIGYIIIALVCTLLIRMWHSPETWHNLLFLISLMSLIILLLRINFKESPGWLLAHHRRKDAEKTAKYFLGNDVKIKPCENQTGNKDGRKYDFFDRQNLKKIIFTGMPWACEGLGIYGIGIFTPLLLMQLVVGQNADNVPTSMDTIVRSVEMTTWINVFILIGFSLGLLCVNRFDHIKMQVWGFIFSAIGLSIMLLAYHHNLPMKLAIGGFMVFQLFINAGPHLLTFIMPSQVYPISERSEGAGIAAAFGKIGAIIGVLLIPQIIHWWGLEWLLIICIITQLLGALITEVLGKDILLHN